jgi:hypothetical protein
MTRFSFARCANCQRLNIYGARCVCDPLPELDCDCTRRPSNTEHVGPKCAQRIRDDWSEVFRRSHANAREIAEETP